MHRPDQEVLEYSLDEERNNNNTDKEVKGVTLENNVITIRVDLNGLTADQVYFYLKDLPEGAIIEGLQSESAGSETNKKVFVKAQEGTYEFTIKTDKGSTKVTVNVVDVTMPKFKMFKSLRAEEIVAISDEAVKYNSEEVKFTSPATFSGNVNLMKASTDGAKYYKVRVETEKYDNTNVIAVNQKTLKEYKTEPVIGAANEVYVYLDANEAEIPLVLKHKDATEKQVKEAVATKVTFNTTSIIWVNKAEAGNKYYSYRGTVINAKVNSVNQQVIDIGVDFDKLPKATFKVVDGKVTEWKEDSSKGEKWIALSLELTKEANREKARTITNAVHTDSTNIILDKSEADPTWRWVWIRAEGEGTVKFTLTYTLADNKVEELPITVNLHDIKAPLVTSVSSSTVGIANAKVDDTVDNKGKLITVDSYKYGMDATVERKETKSSKTATTGRWYSLELKTNVDPSSLVYKDDEGKWAEIPEDMISDGKIVVWLNADKTDDLATGSGKTVITLANRYANDIEIGETTGSGTEIKVKRTEKSKTEIYTNGSQLFTNTLKTDKSLSELNLNNNVNVEELYEDLDADATLKNNLIAIQKATITYSKKDNLNTIKLNTNNIKTIKVNGEEGKWIVVHFAVRNSADLTDAFGDSKTLFVDKTNDAQLLQNISVSDSYTNNEQWKVVPMWINLSSDKLKNEAKVEIPLKSTNPDETNSLFIKVIDENVNEPLKTVEKPSAETPASFKQEDGNVNKEAVNQYLGWSGETLKGHEDAFMNNLGIANNAVTTIDQVVDNTVYMTVRADLKSLEAMEDDRYRLPLEFDISSIGLEDRLNLSVYGAWYEDGKPADSLTNIGGLAGTKEYELMKFNFSKEKVEAFGNGASYTNELFFINGTGFTNSNRSGLLGEIADKQFIRYVITFKQI